MKMYRHQAALEWLLTELRGLESFTFADIAPHARQVRHFEAIWRQLTRRYLVRIGGGKRNAVWRVKGLTK